MELTPMVLELEPAVSDTTFASSDANGGFDTEWETIKQLLQTGTCLRKENNCVSVFLKCARKATVFPYS